MIEPFYSKLTEETYDAGRNRAGLSAANIDAVFPLWRLEDRILLPVVDKIAERLFAVMQCRGASELPAGALTRLVSLVRNDLAAAGSAWKGKAGSGLRVWVWEGLTTWPSSQIQFNLLMAAA